MGTHICELCGHVSPNRGLHASHFDRKHSNSVYECDICGTRSNSKDNIKVHIRVKHIRKDNEKFVECDICHKTLNKLSMIGHMICHDNELRNRFKCSFCGKGFPDRAKIKVILPSRFASLHKCFNLKTIFRVMRPYTQVIYRWSVRTAGNGFVLRQRYRYIAKKYISPELSHQKSLSATSATMFTAHHRHDTPIGKTITLTKLFQDNVQFFLF